MARRRLFGDYDDAEFLDQADDLEATTPQPPPPEPTTPEPAPEVPPPTKPLPPWNDWPLPAPERVTTPQPPPPEPTPIVEPPPRDESAWYWNLGGGSPAGIEQDIWNIVRGQNPAGGLDPVLGALRAKWPGTSVADVGSGIVNIPGYGNVDIIRNAGGPTPQWWSSVQSPRAGGGGGGRAGGDGGAGDGAGMRGGPAGGGVGRATSLPPPQTLAESLRPDVDYSPIGERGVMYGVQQPIGQDPLSELITNTLGAYMENAGVTPWGQEMENSLRALLAETGEPSALDTSVTDAVRGLLERGGALDEGRAAQRWETQRELMDKARRGQIAQSRAELANRGLLSEPGVPQGAESQAIRRIESDLGVTYAGQLREMLADESERAEARLLAGLGIGAGLTGQEREQATARRLGGLNIGTNLAAGQSQNLLDALRAGTERQNVLSSIAIDVLDRNIAWNRFLAEFGLERDQILAMIREGRVSDLIPIVQMFQQLAGQSAAGYI